MATVTAVKDWREMIPENPDTEKLFDTFKEKAEALTAKVLRFSSAEEAEAGIAQEILAAGYKKVVSVPLSKVNLETINAQLAEKSVAIETATSRDMVEKAELGISEFDMGIAALGTMVQDATDVYKRLVSTLPPAHLAIVSTKTIVDTFEETLVIINQIYGADVPPFIAYVTGPSKTADIERVLTIGVHGPGRLIIICIDE